ncbi:unnamed protein product [Mycena citricolor]|uniref:CFA20 domain-containing protein n=1 Tax=Mycena citricolor TaxID=2018698 RepID=A0AAD2HGZ3_9AGAR|nr:unnamed protein product [Mycena citricolor]
MITAHTIRQGELVSADSDNTVSGLCLDQTVLHIQSPTLPTTFIRCPPGDTTVVGLKHPWIHLQVRDLGREWSLELGVADRAGTEGVIRLSTFKKQPTLTISTKHALLHLPLSFPALSDTSLTAWSTINLHLPTIFGGFRTLAPGTGGADDHIARHAPMGPFSHSTQRGPSQQAPWEFGLYGNEYR